MSRQFPVRDKASPLHRKVINAYLRNGFKKVDAMREAGYSEMTATKKSEHVFNRPEVVREIDRQMEKATKTAAEKLGLTQEWLLARLMRIANAPEALAKFKYVGDDGEVYYDFTGASQDEMALIQDISVEMYTEGKGEFQRQIKKWKVGTGNPQTALVDLMKHLGMFKEKIEISGESIEDLLMRGRQRANVDEIQE